MKSYLGPIYLFCAFSLAGTSVIAARFLSASLGTFTIAAGSLLFAIAGLLPLAHGRLSAALAGLRARDWLGLLFQATCGIFLFRLLLIQGLLRTSTGEAGILTGAAPAATAVLAIFLFKEPARPLRLLGISSTVAGIAALQGIFLPGAGFTAQHSTGNLLVLGAAGCEALFNVISRFSSRSAPGEAPRLDPIVQALVVTALAFLLCLAPAGFENPLPALRALGAAQWLALAWYGLFVTALSFVFFYAGIRRSSAITAAVFSGMMPLTGLALSLLLLGEHTGWQQLLGAALIVLGMVLIGGERLETEVAA